MGKGQRARQAAAAAALAAALAPKVPPPSPFQPQAELVAPSLRPTARAFVPQTAKTTESVTSSGSSDDADAQHAAVRQLESDEDREKLCGLRDDADPTALNAFLDAMLARVSSASTLERGAAARDLVVALEILGAGSVSGVRVLQALRQLVAAKPAPSRDGALRALAAMCQCDAISCVLEPIVVELLPTILLRHADKEANVRESAMLLADVLVPVVNPLATRSLLQSVYQALELRGWQSKVAALGLLRKFSAGACHEVATCLPELIPQLSELVWDTKREVQDASLTTLKLVCSLISNDDVVPLVPVLVDVIAKPELVVKAIDSLLATTFVANVDAPTLALIAPLLNKALRDVSVNSTSLKRKASAVIDSMCRLVSHPSDVQPFVPLLLPQLNTVIDRIADKEVADTARDARERLVAAAGDEGEEEAPAVVRARLQAAFKGAFQSVLDLPTHPGLCDATLEYVADVCTELAVQQRGAEWRGFVLPYLTPHMHDSDAERVSEALKAAGGGLGGDRERSTDPNDVCDLDISLAYGGKILLRNARLRLTRGHRYGLVGKNGVGKTTLMRNIASGAIDGLPTELRTVYVQHEDVVPDQGSLLASMVAAPELSHQTAAHVEKTLLDIGFTRTQLDGPIGALSGGWRMKLAIARAMLYNADVLLLDEPTNHLDVHAVQWLVDYLNSLENMTVLLVSHDTGFLDNVCTDILHYEAKQLVLYPGSLSHFVTLHPEAKHYYELAATDTVFRLPPPGRLEGISSTTRRILTLTDCSFTYPGASKPQLEDVNVKLCLASRVAVIGANGAGKSTLIKMLVQETAPTTGEMWKHHNLRVAYVAQHSFHHVEQHLDSSPVEYIQWRFGTEGGVDRELESRVNMAATAEELALVGTKPGQIERIVSRTKGKRGQLEYECKIVGMSERHNRVYTGEQLIEMGLGKLVEREDARQATLAAGTDLRPLTTREVQRHLDDFGLNKEFGTYGKIRGLSGGQKVKLVIAAAMWVRPHLLVLDEPTNYLDRAALGALAEGIREFAGGCIMISHAEEFYNALCTEHWLVENGRVRVVGEAQETAYRAGGKIEYEETEEEIAEKNRAAGCTNTKLKKANEGGVNPKTLRPLSKQEIRKLSKIAAKAGKSFDEYLAGIDRSSPEWKWL
ncbi:hypothetical protein P43SY_000814 [Pythium insidiosum]|uniref:ABC transporter domain-containing protein n=1 Tax=Pythium insidiosum TaxID=114742 RepID=A0AAD5Q9C4_PYTIN|nr:hypothetical protein P43SY_000814 [Pythium insidiosum]